mmetsp:Transcript_42068/g.48789  ORF Transcript_42068/g.48789 Transcript_42068/m.48789 type:complete len:351 (+) Transcript_42068:1001-2053(+)
MAFDSKFIYAYQAGKGLLKFGATESTSSKLGQCYFKNSGMSDDHRHFMFFEGQLYCRAKNTDDKPFVLVDTETLQEITDNEEFNKKIEALKPSVPADNNEEEKKAEEKEEDEKTPDGPKLGWTKTESDDELKEGRYLCESPLFTDGRDIYVVSTEREVKVTKKEEEDLDEDRKELVVKKWNLEVYDGHTWKFKQSYEIKLDVKVKGLDEQISDAEEKEIESTKLVRESFGVKTIAYCSFATNGTKLLVGENKRWHIFDLTTSKWQFNLILTTGNWGYDYASNTFWEITCEPQVKSFKIPAFKRLDTGLKQSKSIIEYINSKVNEIQGLQTVKDKLSMKTPKTLFKTLIKK